jgi:hypothetical protein
MKKILVVSATQKNEEDFWNEAPLGASLQRHIECNNVDKAEIVTENSAGLCEVYNRFLTKKYKDYIILFVHDDLIIQEINLKSKLNDAIEFYDLIGIAGTAEFGLTTPVVWHNSPREKWSGSVSHPLNDKQAQVNAYGPSPKRCMVIDGLFMAVNTEKVLKSGVKWDEQFMFHFYDLAFSVDAHLAGLNIGTWDIPCTHFSHGNYDSDSWRSGQDLFIKKYTETGQ